MNDILPKEPEAAIRKMIAVTEALTVCMEQETNAAAMNDAVAFSVAEEAKGRAAEIYQKAAAEFQARVEDFKGQDQALVDQLEASQHMLGEATQKNINLLKRVPGIRT